MVKSGSLSRIQPDKVKELCSSVRLYSMTAPFARFWQLMVQEDLSNEPIDWHISFSAWLESRSRKAVVSRIPKFNRDILKFGSLEGNEHNFFIYWSFHSGVIEF